MIEHRVFKKPEIRFTDDGNGAVIGYGNTKGYLDDYGTIWTNGAYTELDALLTRGFVPDTHSVETGFAYTLDSNLGMITSAIEDEIGLLITVEFHSKQRAQDARTDLKERFEKGKFTGFSIGFEKKRSFKIYPKNYATQLPQYVKPEYLQEAMERAKQYSFVEVMVETPIKEVSITLIPANEISGVTEVRTQKPVEQRSEMLGEYIEGSLTVSALCRLMDALMWNVFYDVCYNEAITLEEGVTMLTQALDEFKDYSIKIYKALSQLDAAEDTAEDSALRSFATSLRLYFNDPKDFGSRSEQKLQSQLLNTFESVRNATSRVEAIAKLREESRSNEPVRQSNHEALTTILNESSAVVESLRSFLAKHKPESEKIKSRAKALRLAMISDEIQEEN